MPADSHVHIANLLAEQDAPAQGTLSRTLHNDEATKVVLFSFATGEELSEHTASMPAVMHFLSGQAHVTVGDSAYDVGPNAWVQMAPNVKHSIRATEPLVMLLTLVKAGKA